MPLQSIRLALLAILLVVSPQVELRASLPVSAKQQSSPTIDLALYISPPDKTLQPIVTAAPTPTPAVVTPAPKRVVKPKPVAVAPSYAMDEVVLDGLLQKYFGDAWKNAKAISKCESGWVPTKHNFNHATRDDSWGLFQINLYGPNAKSRPKSDWLIIPENNIAHAAGMYKAMGRFGTTGGWFNCAKKLGIY